MLLDIFYYLLKKIEKIFSQSEENMIRKGFMTKKIIILKIEERENRGTDIVEVY